MLSVCIPIFNQDVSELIQKLHIQAMHLGTEAEILLIDDASEEAIREKNRKLSDLPLVRYEELEENIGRSRIRNTLSKKARHPLLLFLDCDVTPVHSDFLKRYLEAGKDGSVVCGGHLYQEMTPKQPYLLHWLAGSTREARDATTRQANPHNSFMTASFLLPAATIYELPFNEEINGYGHEDTLYGFQLKQRHIPVKHIDNPVMHNGLEQSAEFLEKTKHAMSNLRRVYELTGSHKDFRDMVKVLKACENIRKWRLHALLGLFCRLSEKHVYRHLCGKSPRLWMLDIYKLSHICHNRH